MTQAQDLAAQGYYGTPQDYYDATGNFYAPVNLNDPSFNGASTLVDSLGRPWVSEDISGPAMLMVDAQHATADHPVGTLIGYNDPARQSVYRDMPQTGFTDFFVNQILPTFGPAVVAGLLPEIAGAVGAGGTSSEFAGAPGVLGDALGGFDVGAGGATSGALGLGEGAATGASAGIGTAAADQLGLAQMALDAGVTDPAQVAEFVSSGGTLGSTAAGGGGIGLGSAVNGVLPGTSGIPSDVPSPPGTPPGTPPPAAPPGTPPSVTPPPVPPTGATGPLSDIANIIGLLTGIKGLVSSPNTVPPAALTNAGTSVFNTALDPQNALHDRTQQQIQDAARASSSAHGVAMSPFAAGTENKAVSDFNIDWQNQQLQRMISALGAFTNASGGANAAAGVNTTNNANSMQAILAALTNMGKTPGSWMNNLFNGGQSAPATTGGGAVSPPGEPAYYGATP